MSKTAPSPRIEQKVMLKDPALAALLAWLVPGLGHVFQGRTAKGVLFITLEDDTGTANPETQQWLDSTVLQ